MLLNSHLQIDQKDDKIEHNTNSINWVIPTAFLDVLPLSAKSTNRYSSYIEKTSIDQLRSII